MFSKSWDNGVNKLVSSTEENLAELEKAKSTAKAAQPHRFPLPAQPISSSRKESPMRKNGSFSPTASYEAKEQMDRQSEHIAVEKKLDILLRKQKTIDDRLFIIENSLSKLKNGAQKSPHDMYSLPGEYATLFDKWEQQTAALTTKVGELEEIIAGTDSVAKNKIGALIDSRLDAAMSAFMESIIDTCLREQRRAFDQHAEKIAADNSVFNRNSQRSADMVSDMEKETLRQKSEIERLKSRQTFVDNIYSELRASVYAREAKAEEEHKRAIASYRNEMDELMQSVTRHLHKAVSSSSANNVDAAQLRVDLEDHILKTEYKFQDAGFVTNQMQQLKSSIEERLDALAEQSKDTVGRLYDTETAVHHVLGNLEFVENIRADMDSHSDSIAQVRKDLKKLEDGLGALSNNVRNVVESEPLTLLAQSIDDVNTKFDSLTKVLKTQLDTQMVAVDRLSKELADAKLSTEKQVKNWGFMCSHIISAHVLCIDMFLFYIYRYIYVQ
jgi:hypothetical protein